MPTPPPKHPDIALSLTGAKCLKFGLTNYGRTNKASVPDEDYEFSLSVILSPAEKNQWISVRLTSQLFEKKTSQLKLELAEIHVSCSFFIRNFRELISKDSKGNLAIPDSLIQVCTNVTFGVARGMFAIKLEKTLYANALLPLIDKSLLKNITSVNDPALLEKVQQS